jgi:hypothetical protein
MTRRKAVTHAKSRDERSPERLGRSRQERPEHYAAAALNVVNDNSTAVPGAEQSDDSRKARGRREESV